MAPELPAEVVVLPGTDVAAEWERFEVFDALHHLMQICNPMTSDDLDAVLDALSVADGESLLDIACGHGELVLRAAERRAVRAVGIDLSPWTITRSVDAARGRDLRGSLEWRLGDAHRLSADERFDVVTCLGASWIWHGFRGTAAALVRRTGPGGRLAIGDLRVKDGVDGEVVSASLGRVLTADEQARILEDLGISDVERIDTGPTGGDGYQDRILASAEAWATEHPGATGEQYLAEQRAWRADHDRDRAFLAWSVWVGEVPG